MDIKKLSLTLLKLGLIIVIFCAIWWFISYQAGANAKIGFGYGYMGYSRFLKCIAFSFDQICTSRYNAFSYNSIPFILGVVSLIVGGVINRSLK